MGFYSTVIYDHTFHEPGYLLGNWPLVGYIFFCLFLLAVGTLAKSDMVYDIGIGLGVTAAFVVSYRFISWLISLF
jgi:hypothetical protein